MFTATGYAYGEPYTLTWDDGTLSGTDAVVAFLTASVGQPFLVPATGPEYTLDLSDPASVLAALHDATTVEGAEGDVPQIVPDDEGVPADAVY